MKAIVTAPVCPLLAGPCPESEPVDEVLHGMTVTVLDKTDRRYWRVGTHYRYQGYARADCLLPGDGAAAAWREREKKVVFFQHFADVLPRPTFRVRPLLTLPLGAVVSPVEAEGTPAGWTEVALPDGRRGYVRSGILAEYFTQAPALPEDALRARLVRAALGYRGAPYRWGGKTPQGIDCSGLVSMSYLLCGMVICRDARLEPGFDLVEIPRQQRRPGDALFFSGHVALCLGGERYVHATGKSGSDGVTINSLEPSDPAYRPDLAAALERVGSYKGFWGRRGEPPLRGSARRT